MHDLTQHRPSKQATLTLIRATLDGFAEPMRVAKNCFLELNGHILANDRRMSSHQLLANAKNNQQRMLPSAALVRTTLIALRPIMNPDLFGIRISYATAVQMLPALGTLIAAKREEKTALLESCAEMFAPGMDAIGQATGLWQRVSKHPVILALALQKLLNVKVFASQAELRTAMLDAEKKIKSLFSAAESWMNLLCDSDHILFERDRAGWRLAYSNVSGEIASAMLASVEMDEDAGDDEDAISPRWAALNELRQAKLAAD
jgi:hypothetical protein